MHKVKILIGLLAFVLFSCGDKEVEIPSYIYIDHIDLETETAEGSNLHKITDVWVTIGPDFVGAFELPCKIPIQKEGEFGLVLRAGIQLNGIFATRIAYSPYQICTPVDLDGNEITTITLKRGEVTSFNAKTKYKKDITFEINEAFESAGKQIDSEELTTIDGTDTTVYSANLLKTDETVKVYEGQYSGVVHLTKENHTVFITSSQPIEVPENGSGVGKYNYMEVDFKTDVDLAVGLLFGTIQGGTQIPWGGLRATDEWKKVYMHISPEQAKNPLSQVHGSTTYKPYIYATLPDDMDEAFIYLDNVKLIHE